VLFAVPVCTALIIVYTEKTIDFINFINPYLNKIELELDLDF
jgi:hypothetical protein